jgi:type II secretory pathway pseudopilin PulG
MIRRMFQSRPTRRAGLGLAEACISLAICAALLTAVAAAFRAAGDAVTQNDQFFTATQSARVALNRMLTQVRRGTPGDDSTSSNLHLLTDTGMDVNYNYDSSTKKLSLVTSTSTILVHDASQCSFAYTTGTDSAGNSCVSKVTVTIGVTIGNNSILLTGSAAPRRSLTY